MKATSLFYSDIATGGTSDKEYNVQIEKSGPGFVVNFQYGRRGGTLQTGTKTKEPVSLQEAERIYDKLVHEKISGGYQGSEATSAPPTAISANNSTARTPYPVELLEEVDRDDAEELLASHKYFLQPKIDGHRIQIELKPDGTITGYNKKGGPVGIPSEVATEVKRMVDEGSLFLDGELVGNAYIAFDLLLADGKNLTSLPYSERLRELEEYMLPKSKFISAITTYRTTQQKTAGLAELQARRAEGGAFKLAGAAYACGKRTQHKKFKFLKSCTAKVVGTGFKGHDSATLAAHRDGKWVEIGRASLIGKDKRIAVGSFVEVTFLYMTEGHRLYQPRIKEFRTDADESDCGWKQFKHAYKEGVKAA